MNLTPDAQENLNWVLGSGLIVFLIKEVVGLIKGRYKKLVDKSEKDEDGRLVKIEKEVHSVVTKLREIEITIVKHDVSDLKGSIKELSSDIQELSSALAVNQARIEAENKNRDAQIIELRADIKSLREGRHRDARS
jgi:hypothetical protein